LCLFDGLCRLPASTPVRAFSVGALGRRHVARSPVATAHPGLPKAGLGTPVLPDFADRGAAGMPLVRVEVAAGVLPE